MSDSNVFFSYIVKLAKENLAKLIFYVIAAIVAISFLKWLIFGGFSILFSGFFKLIGLGGHDDKDTIREQGVAISQLETANTVNTETIGGLLKSNEIVQESMQTHYEDKADRKQTFDDIRGKGNKAFQEANKGVKQAKVGGSGPKKPQAAGEPSESEEVSPLKDPQSPESLQLAAAQFTMLDEAYCAASPGTCAK